MREAALGPDHPDTLTSRNNLATAYRYAGRLAEAIALHEETLKLREAKLGPDHPDTLKSRNNLAVAYQDAGRTAGGDRAARGDAQAARGQAGPRPPRHAQEPQQPGRRLLGRRPDAEAIALHEATLKLREAKLGPDHPDTLASRNNLAIAYHGRRPAAEAIALHEATLKLREAKLGPDHPDTLTSRNNLAIAYRAAGRLSEAIALHEATLKLREAKLGPDHPDTLNSRNNLADAYYDAGRTAEAIALHEATLRLGGEARPRPPRHARQPQQPGHGLPCRRPAVRGDRAHEATLKLRRPSSAPTTPTRSSRSNLAAAYESLGRWAEAEGLLSRHAGPPPQDRPARQPPPGRRSRRRSAVTCSTQARWSEAEPLLRECLAIREKATPDDWRRYDAMSLLGGALLGQGRYAEAEPLIVAGYEGMKAREARILPRGQVRLREAAERVVRLYEAWGKPDQAATRGRRSSGMPDLPADVFARP